MLAAQCTGFCTQHCQVDLLEVTLEPLVKAEEWCEASIKAKRIL